jgi:hypothetical protein
MVLKYFNRKMRIIKKDLFSFQSGLDGLKMEKHFKPKSKFRYLVQQVEEQSMLCDFTVNIGLWVNFFYNKK